MEQLESIRGCRLKPEEIEHLDNHWNGKFSDFVHTALKADAQKTKKNIKKNRLQKFTQNFIFIGFGIIILFQMGSFSFGSVGWFVVFAIGMCFFGIGFYGLASEVDIFGRNRKRNR